MQWRSSVVTFMLMGLSSVASAQTCLHGKDELPAENSRRLQALSAIRVVNTAQVNRRQFVPLAQLADSPATQAMRSEGGPAGEAARAMRFDREEMLPGWRVHFVLGPDSYSIALRDTRDPCGFTYLSDESGVIVQGYPITRGPSPLLPAPRP
jgi:hypothetical protein